MENAEELIHEIHTGLFRWYDFNCGSSILCIGEAELNLDSVIPSKLTVEESCQDDWLNSHKEKFDYIISVADLEKFPRPIEILKKWKYLLKPAGTLLLGMNNRLGIRYFCGDRDPYTKRNFDSIENYYQAYANKEDIFSGRMYDKSEIENMLKNSGWNDFKFFSVFTDLKNPSLIYSEDYLPNEDLANRVFPTYNNPDTVFLVEEKLYSSLADNGMFHKMANAYLIECSLSKKFSDVLHVHFLQLFTMTIP